MLTTAKPAAHELSIASNAASPPNEGAVADRGRHGDHGPVDESADDARQSAFHPGHDDERASLAQRLDVREEPVEARDTDVDELTHASAHVSRDDGRLFGDGKVRRAGAHHEHESVLLGAPIGRASLARLRVPRTVLDLGW